MLNWRSIFEQPEVPRVMPLPHPSWRNTVWLKRHPWFEADLLPVLNAEIRHRI
jgi:uracil-DNA glycosylase